MNKEDCYRILEIYKDTKFDLSDDLHQRQYGRVCEALSTLDKIDENEILRPIFIKGYKVMVARDEYRRMLMDSFFAITDKNTIPYVNWCAE